MKRKILALALCLAAALGCAGVSAFALTPNSDLAAAKTSYPVSPASDISIDGQGWHVDLDYLYGGYDVDGNFYLENQSTGACEMQTRSEVALDNLSLKMRLQDRFSDQKISDGANLVFGFCNDYAGNYWAGGIAFVLKDRKWVMNLNGAGRSHANINVTKVSGKETVTPGELTLTAVNDKFAGGTLELPIDAELDFKVKYYTAAELAKLYEAEGWETTNLAALSDGCYFVVNGKLLEINLTKQPGKNLFNWSGSQAHWLRSDDEGKLLGYFFIDYNRINSETGEGGTMPANGLARMTFLDGDFSGLTTGTGMNMSQNGSFKSTTGKPFSAVTVAGGAYRGKTLYASDAGDVGILGKKEVDLSKGSLRYPLLFRANADELTFGFSASSANLGTAAFGVRIERIDPISAAVFVTVDGTEYATQFTSESPMTWYWKGPMSENLDFFKTEHVTLLQLGGIPFEISDAGSAALSEAFMAFSGSKGYFYATISRESDSGLTGRAGVLPFPESIQAGEVERLPMVTSIRTELPAQTVGFGEEPELPASVTVAFEDGTTADWAVTWNLSEFLNTSPGRYTVKGEFADLDTLVKQYYVSPFSIRPALRAEVEVKVVLQTITSFQAPDGIEIEAGGTWTLPTEFTASVKGEDGQISQKSVKVSWEGTVNRLKAGTYTLSAVPEGFFRFDSGVSHTVTVKVTGEMPRGGEENGCGSKSASASAVLGVTLAALALFGKRFK